MSEQPQSQRVVLGAAAGLFVVGVLVALFGSIAYGIVLVLASFGVPLLLRNGS